MIERRKYRRDTFSVIVIFVCFGLIGLSALPKVDVQLNPSRSLPKLSVNFTWPGAAASVIEKEVTATLEGRLASISEIESISSVTGRGSGRIDLEFKKHVNVDAVRFEVANLIRQTYPKLPEQVSYPTLTLSSSDQQKGPLLTYTLSARTNPRLIENYADDHIAVSLSDIKGVGAIKIYGAIPYHYRLSYKPDQLNNYGITTEDITVAVQQYLHDHYIGRVTNAKGMECSILLSLRQNTGFPLSEIPVKAVRGRIMYLDQLVDLQCIENEIDAYYRVNGLNTLNILILPEENVNVLKLSTRVKQHVELIRRMLPAGYDLKLTYDETEFIEKELQMIFYRSLFSISVLLGFVLLISRQLKYALLIIISILVNFFVAISLYYFLSLEINIYTLAGITISLGIIIDNSIVMIDHLKNKGDKQIFITLLAATLTTLASLSAVFLLEEDQQLNLLDFSIVIAINLVASVSIAMFFIPALLDSMPLRTKAVRFMIRRKRRLVKFNRFYIAYIRFSKRFQAIFIIVLILAFGIPLNWLPENIKESGFWSDIYGETLGSDWFQQDVAPILEKLTGGSLRLFTEYVFEKSHYSEPERTTLNVRGSMPEGCTIDQLDQSVRRMEQFIGQFEEVEMFTTSITNPQNAHITILFKDAWERTSFPYVLKARLESRAIALGGLDWSVYGIGKGFSNVISSGYRNSHIQLEGYDYEQLYRIAMLLRKRILTNPRIKEADITEPDSWEVTNSHEYFLEFDEDRLATLNINKHQLYEFLKERTSRVFIGEIFIEDALEEIVIQPNHFKDFDIWDLGHTPVFDKGGLHKVNQLGSLEKRNTGNDIHKRDQQYQLMIAYDFVGSDMLSKKVLDEYIKELSRELPLGFNVFKPKWQGWDKNDEGQYYLIFYIVTVIFVVCSVLFESLLKPLVIIFLIPISFIGVFLTFYFFDINFDQGGFAAFVMVAGLVVNSGIYILNDYKNFRRDSKENALKSYTKAFNNKCMPVLLTILSTVLGLVPFLWQGHHEVFWYAFASGTIGGLAFSLIAVLLYLPIFILPYRDEVLRL